MFKCELSTLVKFSDLATQLQRSVFGLKAPPGSFSVLWFLPWTLLLSQQQKDNDANSKLEMFNFSIVPRLSQPRPLPSFCCGGVVREALLSVRVRTGRCPLGTERKNSVQGLWLLY